MDVFDFILKAIFQESEKCNVFFTSETCNLKDSIDEPYDKAVNRLAYLYKYGIFNVHFFKKCLSNYVDNSLESSNVIDQIHSAKSVCSLSIGPGVDILGLILAFRDVGKTFSKKKSFKIISNNGAWRNSMNALISLVEPNLPILGTFKLLQCNILKSFSSKARNYLQEADVVIMDHTFASPKADKQAIVKALINILLVLKAGTLIIVIDTEKKMSYYQSLYMFGEFIYGPTEIKVEDIPYRDSIVQTIGVEPKRSGKAHFGIWCKSNSSPILEKNTDCKLEKNVSLVNVIPAETKNDSIFSINSSNLSQQKLPDTNKVNRKKYDSNDSIAISNISASNLHSFNSSSVSQVSQGNKSSLSDHSNLQNFDEDLKKLLRSLDGLVTKLEHFVDLDGNHMNCNSISRHQSHFKCMCCHNLHTVHCKSCMHCKCCVTGHCEIKNECSHKSTNCDESSKNPLISK